MVGIQMVGLALSLAAMSANFYEKGGNKSKHSSGVGDKDLKEALVILLFLFLFFFLSIHTYIHTFSYYIYIYLLIWFKNDPCKNEINISLKKKPVY
jgi:hypothetical protein